METKERYKTTTIDDRRSSKEAHSSYDNLPLARQEYITNSTSKLTDLHKKYLIPYETLRYWKRRETWDILRQQLNMKTTEKALNQLSTLESEKIVKERLKAGSENSAKYLYDISTTMDGVSEKVKTHSKIEVAKDILDRAGFKAPEKIEIELQRLQAYRQRVSGRCEVVLSERINNVMLSGASAGTVGPEHNKADATADAESEGIGAGGIDLANSIVPPTKVKSVFPDKELE